MVEALYYCLSLPADIYDHLDAFLEEIGVTCECVGGGKIDHDSVAKTISVFGHSQVRIKLDILGFRHYCI